MKTAGDLDRMRTDDVQRHVLRAGDVRRLEFIRCADIQELRRCSGIETSQKLLRADGVGTGCGHVYAIPRVRAAAPTFPQRGFIPAPEL